MFEFFKQKTKEKKPGLTKAQEERRVKKLALSEQVRYIKSFSGYFPNN